MRMSYDSKCEELAEAFLESEPGETRQAASDRASLAQAIQDAVKAWFAEREARRAPCLTSAEQKAQGARCGCRGADDLCPCQNVPDATTRRERAAR